MTGDQLIEEGRRLARPCVYLRSTGKEFAGIWRGEGIVPQKDLNGDDQHWLTIDANYLPFDSPRLTGCLSVYTNSEGSSGAVHFDKMMSLPASNGIKLFAHQASSLPPINAIFRLGSVAVERWLAVNDWHREWGYNDNFRDHEPALAYERIYQDQLPLYNGSAHAVLGGWHFPWPDDDANELASDSLMIWTFEDAEPWIEVWYDRGRFRVIQRIT
jgi:hypothetical protein